MFLALMVWFFVATISRPKFLDLATTVFRRRRDTKNDRTTLLSNDPATEKGKESEEGDDIDHDDDDGTAILVSLFDCY